MKRDPVVTEETIYALSSGAGKSGVAVLRLSGPASRDAVRRIAGGVPPARRAQVRALRSAGGDAIDEALVLFFEGPRSFTGEDMAEFHVHGSRAVIAAVLDAMSDAPGCVPAAPGAFTRRAFENGRLDLTQVEGLADLIDAETEAQRRQALRHLRGGAAEHYERWRGELIACLAYFEADIDFADEMDVPDDVLDGMRARLGIFADEIDRELERAPRSERLRDGLQAVIAGPPNVGKSALLNALARRDAAIVSDRPGTTRDVIEVRFDLAGFPVVLSDTAGLREAADEIEREGVSRTRARIDDADVILWVHEAGRAETDAAESASDALSLRIANKVDLIADRSGLDGHDDIIAVSALTGEGIDRLLDRLAQAASDLFSGLENSLVSRARHRHGLERCRDHVRAALAALDDGTELAAEELRLGARELARITGRIDVEDLLDVVFRDFCIGK